MLLYFFYHVGRNGIWTRSVFSSFVNRDDFSRCNLVLKYSNSFRIDPVNCTERFSANLNRRSVLQTQVVFERMLSSRTFTHSRSDDWLYVDLTC